MAKKDGTLFGGALTCKVLPFQLITVNANHEAVRHVVIRARVAFAPDVAADLGPAGEASYAAIEAGGRSNRFPMMGGQYHLTLEGTGDGCEPVAFKGAAGQRCQASIKEPSKSDPEPEPMLTMAWEASWEDAQLVALAHMVNQQGLLSVALTQPSLLEGE